MLIEEGGIQLQLGRMGLLPRLQILGLEIAVVVAEGAGHGVVAVVVVIATAADFHHPAAGRHPQHVSEPCTVEPHQQTATAEQPQLLRKGSPLQLNSLKVMVCEDRHQLGFIAQKTPGGIRAADVDPLRCAFMSGGCSARLPKLLAQASQ